MATLRSIFWLNIALNVAYPFLFNFDFVFKSGEFYGDDGSFWGNLTVELLGAALGAVVTVGLFVWALWNGKNKESEAKNDIENERLLYPHHLVSNSIMFTEHFRDSLNKFYFDFEKDQMILSQLDQLPSNDLQRITHNIDREIHFHAYRIHVKRQGILKFYGSLDYIEQVRTQIFDSLGKAKTHDFERKLTLREKFDELTDHCRVYLQNYKLGEIYKKEERDKVNRHLRIHIKITQINPVDYEDMAIYFAKPLVAYYVGNDIKELSPDFIEIAMLASKIIKLPNEIKANNRRVAESFKSYADDVSPVLEKLQEEFRDLDGYCNKMFPDQPCIPPVRRSVPLLCGVFRRETPYSK